LILSNFSSAANSRTDSLIFINNSSLELDILKSYAIMPAIKTYYSPFASPKGENGKIGNRQE
jgi:hypothetical protein